MRGMGRSLQVIKLEGREGREHKLEGSRKITGGECFPGERNGGKDGGMERRYRGRERLGEREKERPFRRVGRNNCAGKRLGVRFFAYKLWVKEENGKMRRGRESRRRRGTIGKSGEK